MACSFDFYFKERTLNSRKVTMLLIFASSLLPIVLAMVVYFGGFAPQGTVAKGELLSPVLTIEEWGGEADVFSDSWSILKTQAGACDSACDASLEPLRRVHDALGREANRVQVIGLGSDKTKLEPAIWIVDPLGNLVMRYSADTELKELLEDLKKLLKVSRIG
jgi:hypothetical protein